MGITPDPRLRPAKPKVSPAARRRRLWMIFGAVAAVVAVALVLINLGIFTPSDVEAQGNALRALGMINTAQFIYSARHPDQRFATSLGQLEGDRLIDGRLASGGVSGYTIALVPGEPDEQGRVTTYTLTARSLAFGQPSFFADQTGVIRSTTEGRDATDDDPPLGSGTPAATPPAE